MNNKTYCMSEGVRQDEIVFKYDMKSTLTKVSCLTFTLKPNLTRKQFLNHNLKLLGGLKLIIRFYSSSKHVFDKVLRAK